MSMSTSGAKAMSDCSLKVQLERRSAALRADASRTALSKADVFGVVMFIVLQLYSHFEFAIGFFEVVWPFLRVLGRAHIAYTTA